MDRSITVKQALLGAAVVVVLSLVGSAALAGAPQTFTDVDSEHPFYDDVEAIAAAGITTGFPDGSYRPGATVTRQAMAAFMGRGFSRIGYGAGGGSLLEDDGDTAELAAVTVDAGATDAGVGYVQLVGTANAFSADPPLFCPCTIEVRLLRQSDGAVVGNVQYLHVPGEYGSNPFAGDASTTLAAAAPIPADTSETYVLEATAQFDDEANVAAVSGTLTAVYAPFAASEASTPPEPGPAMAAGEGGRG